MDEYLSDDQQADRVKQWLRENGLLILAGMGLVLGGLFGLQRWQAYELARAEQASALYDQFAAAIGQAREVQATALLADLAAEHEASPYLAQARLLLARFHMDRNEADEAASQLAAVAGGKGPLADVARLRLARVRLHQRDFDAALESLVIGDENAAIAPRFHEVRGDVYEARGEYDEARREYELALAGAVEQGVVDRAFVQAKLDSLPAPAAAAAADGAG